MEMLIKKFDEYSKEELVELYRYWWKSYGKTSCTTDEMIKFDKLLNEDIDFVRKSALIAYAGGVGSQDMIKAWRNDCFDKYREAIEKTFSNDYIKQYIEEIETEFIRELVGTYNNSKTEDTLSLGQIMEIINQLSGIEPKNYTIVKFSPTGFLVEDEEDENNLSEENVYNLYKECLLEDNEISNDMPIVDFVIGEGIKKVGVFSSERLAHNKDKIINMIDGIANIESGVSFLSMGIDKNGLLWTSEQSVVEFLLQLGIACEVLEYPLPREMWEALPGGVPLVNRNHEKDNEQQLRTHKPKEFIKVVNEVNNGTYRRNDNN